jgi:hypothetical protein
LTIPKIEFLRADGHVVILAGFDALRVKIEELKRMISGVVVCTIVSVAAIEGSCLRPGPAAWRRRAKLSRRGPGAMSRPVMSTRAPIAARPVPLTRRTRIERSWHPQALARSSTITVGVLDFIQLMA